MYRNQKGSVFKQWLKELPNLLIRAVGVQKSKMNKEVEKEMNYLQDRRDEAIEELRNVYFGATNNGVLLARPSSFPWLRDFIDTAKREFINNPQGGPYISPFAEELMNLSGAQLMLAREGKNKFAEGEWMDMYKELSELKHLLDIS